MSTEAAAPDGHGAADRQATMRRYAVGEILQIVRARRGWSVEEAAKQVGIGHMTLRRIESGDKVRLGTYVNLDRLLDLEEGTMQRAVNDDEVLVHVAKQMEMPSVDVVGSDGISTAKYVEHLGRTAMNRSPRPGGGFVARPQPAPVASAPDKTQTVLQDALNLIGRLTSGPTTPAIDNAVEALSRAIPDLHTRERGDG